MASNYHSSAGVYITETDLSERTSSASITVGAIVGPSYMGPVNERTLVTSARDFIETFGKPDNHLTFMHYAALSFLEQSNRLYVTRVDNMNDRAKYGGVVVKKVGAHNQTFPFVEGYTNPAVDYTFTNAEYFIVYAKNPGAWNSAVKIEIDTSVELDDYTFKVLVYVLPSLVPVEVFTCTLNRQLDGFGNQMNIEEQINRKSSIINVRVNYDTPHLEFLDSTKIINTIDTGLPTSGEIMFGGTNGGVITNADIVAGWEYYNDLEEVDVSVLINGGYTNPLVHRKMDSVCNNRQDCVAILDMPTANQTTDVQVSLTYRNNLNLDSSYSAIYTPDLYISDSFNGQKIFVPPSGHVASIYAKTDSTANQWSAPAGMIRGNLDILGLRHSYNQNDRDILDASQINVIRVIYGSGIKIWGSSTLQRKLSALSEISVRRLMIMLERGISKTALYSVFEQNTVYLRAKLSNMAESFLEPVKRNGGIYDYKVQCDEENNPPSLIATGDTVLDIFIDPALPVKRIHLNAIIARTGGITFAISQFNSQQ